MAFEKLSGWPMKGAMSKGKSLPSTRTEKCCPVVKSDLVASSDDKNSVLARYT